jgi:release factor glutamine methyltransferase
MISDGLSYNPAATGPYHLIVANPPYISEKDYHLLHPQVKDYEPKQALLAGSSGTEFYQKFIPKAYKLLHPDGIVLMEIGYDQADKIRTIVNQSDFTDFDFIQDYQQKPRIIRVTK